MRSAFTLSVTGMPPLFNAAVGVSLAAMATVLGPGWLGEWMPATRIVPTWPQTVPATALALLCVGLSLHASAHGRRRAATAAVALAISVVLAASVLRFGGWAATVDWLKLPAPATLIAVGLLAGAAAVLAYGKRHHRLVAALGLPVLAVASVRLLKLGLSGPVEMTPTIFDTMSVLTASVLWLLGVATLLHPSLPFARMMAGRDLMSRSLRVGLPCVVLGPVLQAFVVSGGAALGLSLQTRLALAAVVLALVLGALLYAGLHTLQQQTSEQERLSGELRQERDRLKVVICELELARDRANAATNAKNAFLAHMSHEVRTPLNAVIGLSELLQQRSLPKDVERFVGHIHDAGEQLLGLTSDVLDLSRIEAGQMELESVAFEPQVLLDTVLAMVSPQAQAKALHLVADIDPELPASLVGDPLRLRQVLLNLLSNAVKFTARGSVTLRARLLGHNGEWALLCMQVIDTGIGIASDKFDRIFEPFVQADGSITRRYGGSGLGLC
ncbi:histidine kinase dimerization/phospho-acceptor domain-containing protein [Azohydromonas lata]|uniref:histidine kinase dimerization/phospho-acceptor domain-containing protein n=1 Tax=Azohydromonas lata TaxID=45677 RepID=UPI00082E497C|nr:histidine kinase dimerization/phospho-acceptor domain-containing protein [Azohydromonas lata]